MTTDTGDHANRYGRAHDLYTALEDAGLVDTKGRQAPHNSTPLHSRPERDCASGEKTVISGFTNDEVSAYFLEIDFWPGEDTSECARLVGELHSADANILVALAGPRWSVILRRGAVDAAIPKDITRKLLNAVHGSVLVWQRTIPDAEWFVSKYALASEIVQDLESRDPRYRAESLTAVGIVEPGDYIRDSALDDTFAAASAQIDHMVWVTLHVLIEDRWAHQTPLWLDAYLPNKYQQVCVAGHGWVVRLVGEPEGILDEWLIGEAQSVQAILGGSVIHGGERVTAKPPEPPVTPGSTSRDYIRQERFGPQSAEVEDLLKQMKSLTFAETDLVRGLWYGPEGEQYQNAGFEAEGRAQAAMGHTGRSAVGELVWTAFKRARDLSLTEAQRVRLDGSATTTQLDLAWYAAIYFSTWAALGLVLRDTISDTGFTQADYDALTGPWRTSFGPIHLADTPLVPQPHSESPAPRRELQ